MPTAAALLVFGGGTVRRGSRFVLTSASEARVWAAGEYLRKESCGLVVFSGGWSWGREEPPEGSREADLMLALAQSQGIDRQVRLVAETRSRSTVENLAQVAGQRLLAGYAFDARQPLGLVSHHWHLPRIRFLAQRVLGLDGPALLDVPVSGTRSSRESLIRWTSRLYFAGARDAAALVRREQAMHRIRCGRV